MRIDQTNRTKYLKIMEQAASGKHRQDVKTI